MTLETMQREGREGIKQQHNFEILFGAGSMAEQACESFLDQHTAATWKAELNSILESGLLEEKKDCENCNDCEAMMSCPRKEGHNTLARDIKELISNMDTNSVDSIHLNKQAN